MSIGQATPGPHRPAVGRHSKAQPIPRARILQPAQSAVLREQLVAQIASLASAEQAVGWASRNMGAKNSLAALDAGLVEDAFRSKIVTMGNLVEGETSSEPSPTGRIHSTVENTSDRKRRGNGNAINKSVLPISEPRRYRDKTHLKFVAAQACLVCGRQPSDAHHLGFAQPRALSRKVSDEFAVPLCRTHHREVHRCSNEAEWWDKFGIDPRVIAAALWAQTRSAPMVAAPSSP